jgi:hypothetical protein
VRLEPARYRDRERSALPLAFAFFVVSVFIGFTGFARRCRAGAGTAPPCSARNVKLELKAPKNASGLKFDFNFHSSEWPEYICSDFNDGFIAYLSAKGFNGGAPANISSTRRTIPSA